MYFINKYKECLKVLLLTSLFADGAVLANENGKKAFNANCQACHKVDHFTTGPSMVYMRDTYPADKTAEFLNWTKNPGKKNPDTIQMPPMAHLGEDTLTDIHQYILFVTQHLKERQPKPKFKPFRPPAKTFPYLTRKYLPFTSPASIAISLSPSLTLVWDTTIARLRYVYPTHAPFNGENALEENREKVLYWESAEPIILSGNQDISFIGYDMHSDIPEFIYQIGAVRVREKISQGATEKSFKRTFKISGVDKTINLNFSQLNPSQQNSAKLKVNKGQWDGKQLKLTAAQAQNFTVEVSL
ncbi:c-type cytochrome [Gayadomonas joobiniege]|uniref:c-type cytochrome n=1 Tax=Gayadomonas joobiniege TaxID=1234606 RepID=UPI0003813824|nr:c-type cytochrome [Gayadomonas joobiniege]